MSTETFKSGTSENNMMDIEEMRVLFDWPEEMLQQLCDEIIEDSVRGYY